MAKKVLIIWDPKIQGYAMASAYNQTFIDAFKNLIPAGAREWKKDQKIWWFAEPYGKVIAQIATSAFGANQVEFKTKEEVEARQQRQTAVAPAANGIGKVCFDFLSLLDYNEAKTLYRKAQMRLHPDRGGSTEKAAQLNDSWRQIEKEIFHI